MFKKIFAFIKKWFSLIIIVVTFVIVIVSGMMDGSLKEAVQAVSNANPLFMLICVLCYIFHILTNALAVCSFLKREKLELSIKDSTVAAFTGVYYSNITPGATGGFPMQVYYLTKCAIPAALATSSVVCFFISWHLMRVILLLLYMIPYHGFVLENLGSNWPFLLLGVIYNVVLISFWLTLSFTRKPVRLLVELINKVIFRFRIGKDPKKIAEGLYNTADRFYFSMQYLKNHPAEIFRQLIYGALYVLTLNSILYFSYRGVGLSGASFGQIMVMSLCQNVSAAYMPTPGGSGGQELIYELFFGKMISGHYLLAVMLIWRFMSYYLGLILAAIVKLSTGNRIRQEDVVSEEKAAEQ